MSEALYKIFRDSNIDLVGMMVYNHRIVATQMNIALNEDGFSLGSHPAEWRYYLNMSGEYHAWDRSYVASVNEDGNPSIQIIIAGASGPITTDLNKQLVHGPVSDPGILLEYMYGGRAYKQLVAKYPECEDLIFGIFYPIDLQTAISAEDGDILFIGGYERHVRDGHGYFRLADRPNTIDLKLIEPNEISVISDLETWIKNMIFRWYNNDYALVDNMYLSCFDSVTTCLCIPRLMKFRLDRCKSAEANTFHVRQYLDDFGGNGDIVDHLPTKAVHYLYRNAEMLAHESGRASTAKELIDGFLDTSSIPLTRHRLRQDLTSIEKNTYPVAYADTKDLGKVVSIASNKTIDMLAFEEKILAIAPENGFDLDQTVLMVNESVSTRYADYTTTKTLESRISLSNSEPRYQFSDLLMGMWVFCSATDIYRGTVILKQPGTSQRISVSPKNALAIAYYCFSVGHLNVVPQVIPAFKARFVPKTSVFTPSGYTPQPSNNSLYTEFKPHFTRARIEQVTGNVVPAYNYRSPIAFYTDAKRLYKDLLRRDTVLSDTPSSTARALGTELIKRYYWQDFTLNIFQGRSYADLFSVLGIDFSGLTKSQILTYYQDVVISALGISQASELSIRRKQELAIEAMKFFSSYAVHYVYSTSTGEPKWLGPVTCRTAVNCNASLNRVESPVSVPISSISQSSNYQVVAGVNKLGTVIFMDVGSIDIEAIVKAPRNKISLSNARVRLPLCSSAASFEVTYH